MTAITYDYIKKLEQAGFTPAQVKALIVSGNETATKSELNRVEKELTNKIESAETRLEKRMDYRFDLMQQQIVSLRGLIKWLIATVVALIPSIGAYTSWLLHMAGH